MKRIGFALAIVLSASAPALAGSLTFEAGWSGPRGSFAEPTQSVEVPRGAESSFTFGVKYTKPLVLVDLVADLSYVQFGEKYGGPPEYPERETYTHTIIPVTIGLRRSFLGTAPVHPYIGGAFGLYGYMARGTALVPVSGTGEYTEEDFTAVIRPGLGFSAGLIIEVPFTFDLAAEVKYHLMVFQGVGDDRADKEYPYAIDVDSLNFTTVTIGIIF